jgi:hypothetical protein
MTDDQTPDPRIERSQPGAVTGRLKRAIDLMVWQGLTRDDAALKAGLRPHSLYAAFRKSHVKQHYLSECEVLRVSGRAKRLHRLEELAAQDENRNAAVAAIRAADSIPDPDAFGALDDAWRDYPHRECGAARSTCIAGASDRRAVYRGWAHTRRERQSDLPRSRPWSVAIAVADTASLR